ncbi:MAG: ABC transporter ATP-binding protein [Rhodospirillum sp.]|nr:ABC transporter ATP-binding protein [Rhodospirillum sp.]MCF8488973.1 ABC transporter ATP-binding protein [Rhodospirillum sp.]MCF8500014.1 ABC transporter ATP-binding protein [Rhodospirillum sp.]
MTPPLLQVESLRVSFGGVTAVDDLSFTLETGTRTALIGPNGAGKSTLFSLIGGQRRPDGGRVILDGRPVTGLAPHRLAHLGVGRTFQIARVFSSMTVADCIRVPARAAMGRSEAETRAARLLVRLSLDAVADSPAHALSYGDIKRLELAMALAGAPRLLLMDEPTAGMAAAERLAMMDLVARVADGEGVTILFTEHDMDVVFGHADRVLVLDHGRLLAEGTPEAIRSDARVRAVYLGG